MIQELCYILHKLQNNQNRIIITDPERIYHQWWEEKEIRWILELILKIEINSLHRSWLHMNKEARNLIWVKILVLSTVYLLIDSQQNKELLKCEPLLKTLKRKFIKKILPQIAFTIKWQVKVKISIHFLWIKLTMVTFKNNKIESWNIKVFLTVAFFKWKKKTFYLPAL